MFPSQAEGSTRDIGAIRAVFDSFLPHLGYAKIYPVAASIFGMRMRLKAAAVKTKNHSTSSRPRCRVLRRPPTVFIQPKGSLICFRLIVLRR